MGAPIMRIHTGVDTAWPRLTLSRRGELSHTDHSILAQCREYLDTHGVFPLSVDIHGDNHCGVGTG